MTCSERVSSPQVNGTFITPKGSGVEGATVKGAVDVGARILSGVVIIVKVNESKFKIVISSECSRIIVVESRSSSGELSYFLLVVRSFSLHLIIF